MQPKILLSVNKELKKEFYVDAITAAGGVADAKYLPEVSAEYDGLLLCGGSDINPKFYGEAVNGAVNIDDDRDVLEFALIKAFVDAKKPILGICRGHQILNVYFGGTLIQHLDNAQIHKSAGTQDAIHKVTADNGSLAEKLYGRNFVINSVHHQAIKKVGEGLKITAVSGTVPEAFEHESLPIMGFQWHPERLCLSQAREDAVDGMKVFEHFVNMCKK